MSGLEEIVTEGSKKDGISEVGNFVEEGLTARTQDRRGSHDLNTTGESVAPKYCSSHQQYSVSLTPVPSRGPTAGRENRYVGLGGQPAMNGPGNEARRNQEDLRAEFYQHYRKEAKEYDEEFTKKHDVDLNTTLIFTGLFSAVTSAFIAQVQPDLRPDPNDETAALLRVLIYKIDNTTFGGDTPTLPQWTGPPRAAIQVQCILYASLGVSLFSASLAMLGKQWLGRYVSVGMRGSTIERSQDRQRKLDGIIAWYFDHVMGSLPLMSQAALVLLGYAFSLYTWGINTTVASVAIGATLFNLLFYLFIVVAGTTFESCPYQMPWTNFTRGTVRRVIGLSRSTYVLFEGSHLRSRSVKLWIDIHRDAVRAAIAILGFPLGLLIATAIDAFLLGRATFRSCVDFAGRVRGWLFRTTSALVRAPDDQATKSDFRCISWMLRTSLDKTINMSTLDYLGTILPPPGLDPAVVVDCFNIFSNCVVVDSRRVATVIRGSEQLAALSAAYLLRALFRPSNAEPTPTATGNVLPRCKEVFPPHANLDCLPFLKVLKPSVLLLPTWAGFTWEHYCPSTDELVPFARAMAQAAQVEYHRREDEKPEILRVLVRFALRFLSRDPLPPTSVVVDCLTIIATDLGCNVSDTNAVTQDENARLEQIFSLIIQKYDSIASNDPVRIPVSERETMIAFLSYMAQREEADQVFPVFLKYATLDAFRDNREFMWHTSSVDAMMRLWITTAAAVPYTDDVCRTVVDALLQMAGDCSGLQPHIPPLAWDWLKKRPLLYTGYRGTSRETTADTILKARKLGDAELTTSYLFVIWSEWGFFSEQVCTAMLDVIREEFSGVGAARHRAELIQRLNYILSQFDGGWECIHHRYPSYAEGDIPRMKQQYEEFREVLLEADT